MRWQISVCFHKFIAERELAQQKMETGFPHYFHAAMWSVNLWDSVLEDSRHHSGCSCWAPTTLYRAKDVLRGGRMGVVISKNIFPFMIPPEGFFQQISFMNCSATLPVIIISTFSKFQLSKVDIQLCIIITKSGQNGSVHMTLRDCRILCLDYHSMGWHCVRKENPSLRVLMHGLHWPNQEVNILIGHASIDRKFAKC